jgi:hypothetical protein
VPMKGDAGVTSVSVKMIDRDTLMEIDKRDGKIIGISKMTISADGKTAKISYDDELQKRTTEAAAIKQ